MRFRQDGRSWRRRQEDLMRFAGARGHYRLIFVRMPLTFAVVVARMSACC